MLERTVSLMLETKGMKFVKGKTSIIVLYRNYILPTYCQGLIHHKYPTVILDLRELFSDQFFFNVAVLIIVL